MSSNKARFLILVLFLIFFAQLLYAAAALSATIDEGFHITSGYEYLRTGKVRLFDEHPPLAKALFAWPLFLIPDLAPPETAPGYAGGDLIAVARATVLTYTPIDRVIVACRVPVALLCVLLAASVYRLARKMAGVKGGLIALTLFTFDPNILAHGSLATTDLGATAFIFWTLVALYDYLRVPSRKRWWTVAVLLGLAQLTKLTALALVPICGFLIVAHGWVHAQDHRWRALLHAALSGIGMIVVAALIVWLAYGLEVRPVATIANGTLPLPAAGHIERWERLRANLAYGRESFLLGQNRMHGWWQYFPIAFLIKTPLPVLLLATWAFLRFAVHVSTLVRSNVLTFQRSNVATLASQMLPGFSLFLFPVLYAISSLTSTINIGYRHLLPILPFLYVGVGSREYGVGSMEYGVWRRKRESRITNYELRITNPQSPAFPYFLLLTSYSLLFAWLVVGTLTLTPHYLAFFNELAGGPKNGWRFLADSNTDWGQSFKALATYQQENATGPVYLSTFTFLDPAIYGVEYVPIAPMTGAETVLPRRFNPAPGLYAISATTLDGVPLAYPATFDWFRHREPETQIARVMHVYRVPALDNHTWIAQCSTPVTPLDAATITEGFGKTEWRAIVFDCEQSWIAPPGNGWYVRATPDSDTLQWPHQTEHLERWPAWTDALPLTSLRLSYEQRQPGALPAFTIWEHATGVPQPKTPLEPVTLDETLVLLGVTAPATAKAGKTVAVLTYWRALTTPTRPLSLMLHLIDANGATVAVGDGLGVPIEQWRADDVIVQRHIVTGANSGRYTLVSGAYWLDTMERLASSEGDTFSLATIEIKN
ncbi:MAG TPA: glycosyltransferase family 39 protein [Anaerolineae bacterium]|nr:glycosyltransferase family 39 protein [Anaerolineae bacterium]HQK14708.1 glycosyltransferase family 39 protein [Anaerolineae bacterium]